MAGNEVYPWQLWQQEHSKSWLEPRSKKKSKQVTRRRLKYAAGAIGGILVVDFIKRQVGKVPFIGPIISPIVSLCVPTILTGTLLGAAAVYGHERGDPLAARELVPVAEKKLAEASSYVRDNMERALDKLAAPLDDALQDLDRLQQKHLPRLEAAGERALARPAGGSGQEPGYDEVMGALERITKDLLGSPELGPHNRN